VKISLLRFLPFFTDGYKNLDHGSFGPRFLLRRQRRNRWILDLPMNPCSLHLQFLILSLQMASCSQVLQVLLCSYRTDALLRSFRWSPVALFRFSALTFNGHMIHYSDPWCRNVENHPKPVVHGPLNLIGMMDFWRDTYGKHDGDAPQKISYRALSPLYAGDVYTMAMKEGDGKVTVDVTRPNVRSNMSAEITL
jgi:hypothetical protein